MADIFHFSRFNVFAGGGYHQKDGRETHKKHLIFSAEFYNLRAELFMKRRTEHMKKSIGLISISLIASCAQHNQYVAAPQPEPYYIEPYYEYDMPPCDCQAPAPREIQHPRVTAEKIVPAEKKCCDQHQYIKGKCGLVDTYAQENEQYFSTPAEIITYVPAQPEAYTLAANRIFNDFIKETYGIYAKDHDIKVFIEDGNLKESDLPKGIDKGIDAFKKQLANSSTFKTVNSKDDADYIITTTAEWFDTYSKDVPAIKYTMHMADKSGTDVGTWSQIVRRADNKNWL